MRPLFLLFIGLLALLVLNAKEEVAAQYGTISRHPSRSVYTPSAILFFQYIPVPPAITVAPSSQPSFASSNPITPPSQELPPLMLDAGSLPPLPQGGNSSLPLPASRPVPMALFQQHCARCHTAPRSQGNVTLFNERGGFSPGVSARQIWAAIADGDMPRGSKLTPQEKAQVAVWASQ